MALCYKKMIDPTYKLEKELDSMKKIIMQLIKFPGNTYYKDKYKKQRVILEQSYKNLKSEVADYQNISEIIARIDTEIQIFYLKANYIDKKKKIGELKDVLDEMKIELYDCLPESIKINATLEKNLGKNFVQEFKDLKLVYNRSGTCTAFLLRKILEKAIFYCFVKCKLVNKIEDKDLVNKFVTLKSMIEIASSEKVNNVPLLNPKTAKNLTGVKFLGDSSAHNFLCNVEMEEIVPQMPYIITALKELTNENHK